MAVAAQPSRMTADELFERRDDGYRYELVEGTLVRMTPAGARHGVVTACLSHVLNEYLLAHAAGMCCGAETGFVLRGGHVPCPFAVSRPRGNYADHTLNWLHPRMVAWRRRRRSLAAL